MKTFLPLILALAALAAQAQVYKWTDANGKIHYSDQPQDGADAKELKAPRAQPAPVAANDDWQERERASREQRVLKADAERRAAAAQAAAEAKQTPFNPSVNRSNKPMTDQELCKRDSQQIEFAEKTRHLTITHGSGVPEQLTEAQRQEVIRERKANHALTCGGRG
jgi:hypothetical protein